MRRRAAGFSKPSMTSCGGWRGTACAASGRNYRWRLLRWSMKPTSRSIDQQRVRWQNRSHFFAIAGHVMRRVLVDHARARAAAKRGPELRIPLDDVDVAAALSDVDVLALDAALDKLAAI